MKAERLPWFPCYPDKLLGALGGMKSDQQLVYQIILLRIYEVWGPCQDTLEALARRCAMNKRRVSEALDALFKLGKIYREGDGIMNPFAAKIMADSVALRAERVRAGRNGGMRSAEKRKQNQRRHPSKAVAELQQNPTHLHLQEESLFPNGNKALNGHEGQSAEAELFRRGKEILGASAGGYIKNLLKAKAGSIPLARAAIETAATKNDPREYIGGVIRSRSDRDRDQTVDPRL